tara:strand:+ start:946 stop:1338 length:393 start_codon:yes stop_codon:yes gene_type:complete
MNKIRKYGLIVIQNKKLLVNRKFNTKLFLMPGGKAIEYETIEECLKRELKEEHNVEINKVTFFNEYEDIAANEANTIVLLRLYMGDVMGNVSINNEVEEFKWVGRNDNQEILSPVIRNKIFPDLIKNSII